MKKEFQLLQILNDLFIKHLIKLILYENEVKLLKFTSRIGWFVICLKREIFIMDTWNEYPKKSDGMVSLIFCRKFNLRMLSIKKVLKT